MINDYEQMTSHLHWIKMGKEEINMELYQQMIEYIIEEKDSSENLIAKIKDLEEEIEDREYDLETKIHDLENKIEDLEDDISEKNEEICDLKEKISELQSNNIHPDII